MGDRKADFDKARSLTEQEKFDEGLETIAAYTTDKATEYSADEIAILANLISEKITSSEFGDAKKAACREGLDILEGIQLIKDGPWINTYVEVLYEAYSKMNRCARDEERENVWCRLKEVYLEILMMARKIWKDKNHPDRLEIYRTLAKLCKSYLDVADEETIKMCEDFAKEAKFMGKGPMSDEDWRDVNHAIEDIKKHCADAIAEKELLNDSE